MKKTLHEAVDALGISRASTAITVHSLVDLGIVTDLRCQWPTCKYPDEPFTSGRGRFGLALDHITPQREGGSHLPENIRLVHHSCNSKWREQEESATAGYRHELTVRHTQNWLDAHHALQRDVYGIDTRQLDGEERDQFIRTNFLAAFAELGEALAEIPGWKPWKAGNVEFRDESHKDDFVTEIIDVIFFIANVMNACGVSGENFVDLYVKKYGVNSSREIVRAVLKPTTPEENKL